MGGRSGQPCEARTPAVVPCLRGGSRTRTRLGSHQGSPRAHCGPARSWAEPTVQKETASPGLPGHLRAMWLCGLTSPALNVSLKGISGTLVQLPFSLSSLKEIEH